MVGSGAEVPPRPCPRPRFFAEKGKAFVFSMFLSKFAGIIWSENIGIIWPILLVGVVRRFLRFR